MKHRSMVMALFLLISLILSACGSQQTAPVTKPVSTESGISSTAAPEPDFQEITLADDENCTFKIMSIQEDSLWGYTLKVYLENHSDKELMFSLDDVSVNSFMCDPFWATTIMPGMKANEEISFSSSDFSANGITQVTDITFTLNVYDNNNWTADYLIAQEHTLYPLGPDAVQPFIRTPVDGELVLFDNDQCSMVVTGYDPDNLWGYTVNVYLENKTNAPLMFSVDNASVNGYMCDPFWAVSVAPGKRSNASISWTETSFIENGITHVESITLPVHVYNEKTWQDFVTETYTLVP